MVNTYYRSDVTNDTVEVAAILDQSSAISEKCMMSVVVIEREKARAFYLEKNGGFSTFDSRRKTWRAIVFSTVLIN